ncbi:hypothetical protein BKM04_13355 [Pseudomonas syringae pv. syringae]|nr:hypothetical protein BKM04_13355 [Pseudomonas syringae pv. syringae]POD62582.1 hypothetical protein BKM06_12510 [Pseudomonas syringae pv. syringae]POR67658.1 hypothetical protein BKM27_23035 [Pseudomonas syringae pv. syringae]POR76035.1 hypothetical protein BKM30_19855 [Pseudomonas syringae pv. syringae]
MSMLIELRRSKQPKSTIGRLTAPMPFYSKVQSNQRALAPIEKPRGHPIMLHQKKPIKRLTRVTLN